MDCDFLRRFIDIQKATVEVKFARPRNEADNITSYVGIFNQTFRARKRREIF